MKQDKVRRLEGILRRMNSALIAYSGGLDSTFLLAVASRVLPKEKLLAVTAKSETYPAEELGAAIKNARKLKVRHKIIRSFEMKDKRFALNPARRCYYCKKELFSRLNKIAVQEKLRFVLDASNISDRKDFRPGALARKELKVRSPLQQAGISKEEIRTFSRIMGLKTWDKPALACLASRVPYGTRITRALLGRIDKAESFIRRLGFSQVRVRHYNGLCRIEVEKREIPRLIANRAAVNNRLKKLGYNFVTIDLEGYRTGSLNEVLK